MIKFETPICNNLLLDVEKHMIFIRNRRHSQVGGRAGGGRKGEFQVQGIAYLKLCGEIARGFHSPGASGVFSEHLWERSLLAFCSVAAADCQH